MDKAILLGIQEYIRNDYLTPVMLFVSAVGSFGAVWLFMAVLLAFRRSSRGQGILLLIAILLPLHLSFGACIAAGLVFWSWPWRS